MIGLWAAPSVVQAQTHHPSAADRAAVFPVAFYGRGANVLEPGDTLVASLADSVLRAHLEHSGRFDLVDRTRLAQALEQARGSIDCISLACRAVVSRTAGADWMVTAKLSKTSNLIWYLSGQLTHVPSGRRLLDDEFELKGIPEDMARGGARSLARRIADAVESSRKVDSPTQRLSVQQVKSRLGAAAAGEPADLSKMDLSGLDLAGVDLRRVKLTGARLIGTRLMRANLFSADLTDAVLTEADLSGANLDGTVLRRARLDRANLEGASLFATIIEAADLSNANLTGTRIIGYLRSANLRGASLRRANAGADPGNQSMGVMRATFVGADLSCADLTDANLYKADFSHADLSNAKLIRTNLINADLVQTNCTRADLTGAKLAHANVDEAIFTQAVGIATIEGVDRARNWKRAKFDD
ncbi:MAG TPA: pentapeptide repeat-containing protein [Gemmatimonadales bacterium]|nr:pentapeptide repeat-containing protein [Gemmatimonadales bacterium]